jgi:PAS domain S-box-containing protein
MLDSKHLRRIATLILVIIIGVFGIAVYWGVQRENQTSATLRRADAAVRAYLALMSDVRDAQNAQRGFAITGDSSYLSPYESAARQINEHRATLRAHLRREGEEKEWVRLDSLTAAAFDRYTLQIRLRRERGEAAAFAEVATGRGELLMRQVRELVLAGLAREQYKLDVAERELKRRSTFVLFLVPIGTVIAGVLVFVLNNMLARFSAQEEKQLAELRAANVQLMDQQRELEANTVELEEVTEALQESERRFRGIVEHSPDIVYRARILPEFAFEWVSPAVKSVLGHAPEEYYADPRLPFWTVHPDDRHLLNGTSADTDKPVEIRWLKDGAVVWTENRWVPIRDLSGAIVAVDGFARDITVQKQHELWLSESEARFRAVIENSSDIITIANADNRITFVSPGIERVLGYEPEEIVGKRGLGFIHPDDAPAIRAATDRALESPNTPFDVSVRARASGGSWRALQYKIVNLLDHAGIRGMVATARDVTDERRLEEQLLQAQKMDAVGRLAGGIAHDFNNVLTAIKGHLAFAIESVPREEPAHSDLLEAETAANRASALTKQLLTFSRQQIMQVRTVDVKALVADFDRMIRRVIGEDIHIETTLPPEALHVRADAGQLQQVLMNLAVNARDAMPKGGRLRIDVRAETRDAPWPGEAELQGGNYVMLSIGDTGSGMTDEVRSRIFEPFFTTKESGKGTGLGLAIVYGIVKQFSGHIYVYSEPGQGSTFKVFLPQVEAEAVVSGDEADADVQGGTETILVVEDDLAVRALAVRALRGRGYSVLQAGNGNEALAVLAMSKDVRLVLSDAIMPEMRGQELADIVVRDYPATKFILMSGYTGTDFSSLPPGVVFIEKPFTVQSLTRTVRDVLDNGGS